MKNENNKSISSMFTSPYKREQGFHHIEFTLRKETEGPWKITGYKRFNKKVYKIHHRFEGKWILVLEGVGHINQIYDKVKIAKPEYFL